MTPAWHIIIRLTKPSSKLRQFSYVHYFFWPDYWKTWTGTTNSEKRKGYNGTIPYPFICECAVVPRGHSLDTNTRCLTIRRHFDQKKIKRVCGVLVKDNDKSCPYRKMFKRPHTIVLLGLKRTTYAVIDTIPFILNEETKPSMWQQRHATFWTLDYFF